MRTIIALTLAGAAAAFGAVGDVISSFPLPASCAEGNGLTWDGAYLWVCSEGPPDFVQLSTTGSVVSYFKIAPGNYGYFYGAAFDGEYLWCSYQPDPYDGPQFRRYTTTGTPVGSWFTGRNGAVAGMTYENGRLWGAQFKYTTAGSYLGSFARPFILSDLAWDGHYLWTSGQGSYDYQMCQLTTTGSVVSSFLLPNGGYAAKGAETDGQYLWAVVYGPSHEYWVYQFDIGVVDVGGSSFGKIKALYR